MLIILRMHLWVELAATALFLRGQRGVVVSAFGCHLGVPGSNLDRTDLYFSFLSVLVLSLLLIFNALVVDFSHASTSVSSLKKRIT